MIYSTPIEGFLATEMEKIKVRFRDKVYESERGTALSEILKDIFTNDHHGFLAAIVKSDLKDLNAKVYEDCEVKLLSFDDEEGREVFRHSTAHLLAHAVTSLFPDAKPTIGPVVEEGFYYDFDAKPFTPEDIEKIESKMREIVRAAYPIERVEISKSEALELFKDNKFKVEMISEMEDGTISAYRQGDFIDLCRGPHVRNTSELKHFKLFKVAGAYWRGDQRREQLQRIYGISFPDEERLKDHFERLEEAKLRDHRRIGVEMDLFSFHEEGVGFPFWHPKGMILRNEIIAYWREMHRKYGYLEIQTPQILNKSLWERSGHYEHYRKNMYFTEIDENICAVKPMNCPGGLLVYKRRLHSYREFPLRVAELGLVHRHELSGVLHGLFRVRSFTQDDAHIFCTASMIEDEVGLIIEMILEMYRTFGFVDVAIELSSRPEKSIGSDKEWEIAEGGLKSILKKKGIAYKLNEGEGAFYGPKIDFHIKDCIGRSWQCGTIQVDFSMPALFDCTYEGDDGRKHTPVMIHRAILGSLERFIGILIEHYAGKFPIWLNPVQVKILPVSEKFSGYAVKCLDFMKEKGIRASVDLRQETLSKKVRDAQLEHVNYQCVVGGKEADTGTVNVRTRNNENLGQVKLEDFVEERLAEIAKRI